MARPDKRASTLNQTLHVWIPRQRLSKTSSISLTNREKPKNVEADPLSNAINVTAAGATVRAQKEREAVSCVAKETQKLVRGIIGGRTMVFPPVQNQDQPYIDAKSDAPARFTAVAVSGVTTRNMVVPGMRGIAWLVQGIRSSNIIDGSGLRK